MAQKLSIKRYLLSALAMMLVCSVNAQTTTLSTSYTNSPGGQVLTLKPSYLTFNVTNSNSYSIAIVGVSTFHIASATITTGGTLSNNGCKYTLWYNSNSGANAPISTTNGWSTGGASGPITISTNSVIPVISGMNIIIPPSSTFKLALASDDSIVAVGTTTTIPTPASFTTGGVTLSTQGFSWGQFPNGSGYSGQAFEGAITFKKVVPPPTLSVGPSKAKYCINDSFTIVADVPAYITNPTFVWKLNGQTLSGVTGPTYTVPKCDTGDDGTYSVTVSDGSLSSEPSTIDIIIINPPPPKVTGKFNYCLNEPFIPLTVIGSDPRWYYTATGGSPIPVTPTINTSTPNTLFYYVSQTVDGCESGERTFVKLNAAPKPEPPIVTTPFYYCENSPADQLSAIGDTLQWYYQDMGGIPTTIAPTPNTSKKDSFQYWVSQKIDGCESERSRIDIVVTFRPNGLILVDKEEICAQDTIELTYYGSAFPGAAYNWELPIGTDFVGGLDQGPLVLALDSPGTQTIKLQVGHTGCYSEIYTQDVKVKPLPYGKILVKDDLCLGQTDIISMPSYKKTIDTFYWDFDGGQTTHYFTDQGPYGVYWKTPGKKIIKVRLADNLCYTTVYDSTFVHEKPDARITAERTNKYDNVLFNPEEEILCTSDSLKVSVGTIEAGSEYSWTPTRFFDEFNKEPVTFARVDFDSYLKLEVKDEFGCVNSDSIAIKTKTCCEMVFPSAFSPNDDSHNDVFRPVRVGNRQIKTFKVVNRYGQTVYESTGIAKGWDGTLNGEPLDLGTYFYLISFDCEGKNVDQTGEFILIR